MWRGAAESAAGGLRAGGATGPPDAGGPPGSGGNPRTPAPGVAVGAGSCPPRRHRWPVWAVALAAGASGGLLAASLLLAAHPWQGASPSGPRALPQPGAAVSPAVAVYERVAPSVVLVASRGTRPTLLGPVPATDFGTGVIFDPRGYIVTNEHVVAGGQRLEVTLDDGRSFAAQLVGADPSTDLAVLRVAAGRPLPAAVFAQGPVRPGEVAIAIGNPLGPRLHQSVTVGVVSAVRPMLYGLLRADPRVTRMIQTDVAINPGNSGGPLLNAAGQVIGITTVKLPTVEPGVAAAGLGFAIPAATVQRVVADLVRYGYVKRAWLGVRLLAAPPDALPGQPQRLLIAAVVPGSPAARAGLRPGDQVLEWDGRSVRNDLDLIEAIDAAVPGRAVRLTVRRAAGVVTLSLVPVATPGPELAGASPSAAQEAVG